RVRTDLRPAAEGNLLRPRADATVPDGAALQSGSAAAAGDAAEDAAQYRGAGPPARSRSRFVEDRQAFPRALDERTDRLARSAARHAERSAQLGDAAAATAASGAPRADGRPGRATGAAARSDRPRTASAHQRRDRDRDNSC